MSMTGEQFEGESLEQPKNSGAGAEISSEQSSGKDVGFLRKLINGRLAKAIVVAFATVGVTSCDVSTDTDEKGKGSDPYPYNEKYDGDEDGDETDGPLYVKPGAVGNVDEGFGIDPESLPSTLKVNTMSANENFILVTGSVMPGHSEFLDVEIYDSEGREKYGETYEVSSADNSGAFVLKVEDHPGRAGDFVELYDPDGNPVFGNPYEIE